jgi:hypothetical protein
MRVICGASTLERERYWRVSRCPPEWGYPGSSPMAPIGSSVEEEKAEK